MDLLGSWFLDDDEVRAALAARDIGALYRLLKRLGMSQRQIAVLTDQTQSEVCEILNGRKVLNVLVLERIADGLGIPRERMGLGYGQTGPDPAPVAQEVNEEVKRRVLIAAAMSQPYLSVRGEPITLGLRTDDPLPSQLSMDHVHEVRTMTDQLVGRARHYGGQAGLFGDAVQRYTPWMDVPTTDEVKAQLAAALAELHTEAGWACYDSGGDAIGYFTHGMGLADQAGDTYAIANAALHAAATLVRNGHPNDALKLSQLGKFRLSGWRPGKFTPASPLRADDPRLAILTAQLNRQSATAYAVMNGRDEATRYLTEANDGWEPQHAFERAGANLVNAGIQLDLGQLDTAEQSAASAARIYDEGHHRRGSTEAKLILAEVHLRAGEPQGLILARHAISEVSALHSVAARQERLIPLAAALEARPGTDTRELARKARQIATTRT
ncbi:MAG: helix-turn-helix domain-containing protein [Pseudonocardiaceae bacterium]